MKNQIDLTSIAGISELNDQDAALCSGGNIFARAFGDFTQIIRNGNSASATASSSDGRRSSAAAGVFVRR